MSPNKNSLLINSNLGSYSALPRRNFLSYHNHNHPASTTPSLLANIYLFIWLKCMYENRNTLYKVTDCKWLERIELLIINLFVILIDISAEFDLKGVMLTWFKLCLCRGIQQKGKALANKRRRQTANNW